MLNIITSFKKQWLCTISNCDRILYLYGDRLVAGLNIACLIPSFSGMEDVCVDDVAISLAPRKRKRAESGGGGDGDGDGDRISENDLFFFFMAYIIILTA